MKKNAPILALCILLLTSLFSPFEAAAAQGKDPYGPLFPSAMDLSRHSFTNPPIEVAVTENLPQQLRFKLAVPGPNWGSVPPDLTIGDAQRLAGFVSPSGMDGGVVEVMTHKLSAEVNMSDWLLAVMIKSGATILKTRRENGAAGPTYDVLALLPKCGDGKARLVRAAVYRSGQRVFVVRCVAVDRAFAGMVYQFAAAVLLFKPASLAPETLVGNWEPHCLPAGLCFTGPGAGRAKVPWPGRAVQEVGYDLSMNGRITGTLHIKAVIEPELALTSCDQRLKVLTASLNERGAKIKWQGGGVQLNHLNLPGDICFYRGKGWSGGDDVELYVFSWKGDKMGAVVWLLTVGQIADMAAWMRNKRTFEVVCRSLKTSGIR